MMFNNPLVLLELCIIQLKINPNLKDKIHFLIKKISTIRKL